MNMEDKDLEQLVLQGLEIESIEKEKASERKALTRKHGLKLEDAKYSQSTQGQTRDIVAEKLGISGKHWERMKFIYQNKDQCVKQEYIAWREQRLSTSKLYTALKNRKDVSDDIDKILKALYRLDINSPRSMKPIYDKLNYTLFNYPNLKDKVLVCLTEIKKLYDEYTNTNSRILMDIINDVEELKDKIDFK